METTLSVKVPIFFQSEEDIQAMVLTMDRYRDACQYVSDYIFENSFPLSWSYLQEELYYELRQNFDLKAQLAISVIRTTVAKYRTTKQQLSKQKVQNGFKTVKGKEKPTYTKKTLDFLWHPISFKRPQVDLVRKRDFSFKNNYTELSLNTLTGRVLVKVEIKGKEEFFDGTWAFGTSKVYRSGKKWFFILSVSKEIDDMASVNHLVGIDRGIRQVVTTYDEEGKTNFVNGKTISKKRKHYVDLRASLQRKGTKSAKRRIRTIGQRESRWISDVNHCLAKALVTKYGKGTLFVLEDLVDITQDTVPKLAKSQRAEHHSWAFYDLEQKLRYKSERNQSAVITVDAHYTSQRCPKCGRINKENRIQKEHCYLCDQCSYQSNDDRVAAMNIYHLGERYLAGEAKPTYQ